MKTRQLRSALYKGAVAAGCAAAIIGCTTDGSLASFNGPSESTATAAPTHRLGNATAGRDVFRFATFGNEGFWTDALHLQQGIAAAGVTPLQALALGLHVDVDAVPPAAAAQLLVELRADPTGRSSTLLNSPATTVALVNANAVIGIAAKDTTGDGTIDILAGDKTGATCALCHTITDASVFSLPNGGSIGKRLDGRATHSLDFGSLIALGTNSRAYYPVLQLSLAANGGATLGRAPQGLTERSTEGEVDAYLRNKAFYPVGMFDDTFDGNGDPMHNTPLFRQDLAFPFGSEGAIARLDNFSNLVYTGLLDPTTLTTAGGRAFLNKLGGPAGDEIANDYAQVLATTGVSGFPFVQTTSAPSGAAGSEDFPLGVRVNDTMLADLNAYLFGLQAPAGVSGGQAVAQGRELFRTVGCTSCHNVDQAAPVPGFIVPMKTIFPGDNPRVLLPTRPAPLNPVLDTAGVFFDDKMAVVNASLRGLERGSAMPLLLDLARKPVFLHDNSVPTLDNLFDPARGEGAPHPFFLTTSADRTAMVEFLRSLGTN